MELAKQEIRIAADTSHLADLREFLRCLCAQHQVGPESTNRLVLAVDEAVSNVVEHSRVPPEQPISVAVEVTEGEVAVQIRDRGVAFDPRPRHPPPDPLSRRSKRGYGLYLINLTADSIEYKRNGDSENVLTLTVENYTQAASCP